MVEDNDNDVELTKIGFQRAKFAANLLCVRNGEECMAALRKEGKYCDAPTPDLVLLDLNMPLMNGWEVLAEIGKDVRLQHLPVVVLTSSKADEDIQRSYKLRCSSYLVKPIEFANFSHMIQSLGDYWFTLVVLPKAESESLKLIA